MSWKLKIMNIEAKNQSQIFVFEECYLKTEFSICSSTALVIYRVIIAYF